MTTMFLCLSVTGVGWHRQKTAEMSFPWREMGRGQSPRHRWGGRGSASSCFTQIRQVVNQHGLEPNPVLRNCDSGYDCCRKLRQAQVKLPNFEIRIGAWLQPLIHQANAGMALPGCPRFVFNTCSLGLCHCCCCYCNILVGCKVFPLLLKLVLYFLQKYTVILT